MRLASTARRLKNDNILKEKDMTAKKKPQGERGLKDDPRMPMGRQNYILMAAGFALIVIGLVLMSGGGDGDPAVFDADRLYSFRRITLAPVVILAGFCLEIYAIMKRPKAKE